MGKQAGAIVILVLMYYLIYTSYAATPFTDEELTDLLVPSRQRNLFTGITGVLFYFDGKFIQLIEGKEANVKLLYNKLLNDERHTELQLHKEGELKKRLFPNWSMAFKPIAIENINGVHGFNDMTLPNAVNIDSVMTLYRALGR